MQQRKSQRASWYDYTLPWWYFITICTKDRLHYFGEIIDGTMILNDLGNICEKELHHMIQKRTSVDLHTYVIMPNHVHLLLIIDDCRDTGLPCPDNIQNDAASGRPYDHPIHISKQTVWSIVGGWKSAVSKSCHESWYVFARQSRYHDHIIRNEQEFARIKHYIQTNPENREKDSLA